MPGGPRQRRRGSAELLVLLFLFRHGPFALALALLWHGVGQAVGLEGWAAHVARARRTSAVRPRSPSLVQPLLSATWLRVVEPRQNGAECRAPSWALVRRQPRRAHEQRGPHGRSQCRPAEGGLGPDREDPSGERRTRLRCKPGHEHRLAQPPNTLVMHFEFLREGRAARQHGGAVGGEKD